MTGSLDGAGLAARWSDLVVVKPSTRKSILLSALVCGPLAGVGTGLGLGCQGRPANEAAQGGATNTIAPALAGKTIDGEYLALSDLRGQVVLVNVWATWCPPCKKELPELSRLHKERNSEGFSVFAVSVDKRQHLPRVIDTRRRHGLSFPMLFDPEGRALAAWDISGYPTSVLVGRDGTIRWRRNGIIHPGDPELRKQLDAALAEPNPAP